MPASAIDLDRLLKLRVAIGRIGEGERAVLLLQRGGVREPGQERPDGAVARLSGRTHPG